MRRGNPIGRWEVLAGDGRLSRREWEDSNIPEFVKVYRARAIGIEHSAAVSLD